MGSELHPNAEPAPDGSPTEKNISTEHQPEGAARNPSDTLQNQSRRPTRDINRKTP